MSKPKDKDKNEAASVPHETPAASVAAESAPSPAPAPTTLMALTEAVAQVQRWGQFIRAFSRIEETAQAILTFEQAHRERDRQLAQQAADIRTRRDELTALQTEIELAKHEQANIVAEAKIKAQELEKDAQARATEALTLAAAEVERLTSDVNQLMATHADLTSKVAHASDEFKAVTERIETAKAKAREVLGL